MNGSGAFGEIAVRRIIFLVKFVWRFRETCIGVRSIPVHISFEPQSYFE